MQGWIITTRCYTFFFARFLQFLSKPQKSSYGIICATYLAVTQKDIQIDRQGLDHLSHSTSLSISVVKVNYSVHQKMV